jgi:hypothetical protein
MSAGKTQAAAVSTGDEWGLKASEFNVVRYLAHRRDCITFQVQLEGSKGRRLVAMKAYASEQARDQEAGHYQALQGVEGVPELVAGALELTWSDKEERRVHALVVAWVGPPDAGGCRLAPAPPNRVTLIPPVALTAVGVGPGVVTHKIEPLSDMRCARDARWKIRRPDGVVRSFQVNAYKVEPIEAIESRNLFSKRDCRLALGDESQELWPEMSLVCFPQSFSST